MTSEAGPQSAIHKLNAKAKNIASDAKAAAQLLDAAIKKANLGRSPLSKIWTDLQATFRLVGAWIKGEYRGISMASILAAIAGLLYLVNPLDLVTDFLPGVGLLDDATVLGFVIARIRVDLKKFLDWESSTQPNVEKTSEEAE